MIERRSLPFVHSFSVKFFYFILYQYGNSKMLIGIISKILGLFFIFILFCLFHYFLGQLPFILILLIQNLDYVIEPFLSFGFGVAEYHGSCNGWVYLKSIDFCSCSYVLLKSLETFYYIQKLSGPILLTKYISHVNSGLSVLNNPFQDCLVDFFVRFRNLKIAQ